MSAYVVVSALLVALSGLFVYFVYHHVKLKKMYSERIQADGGSILLSKIIMEFGYWLIIPVTRLFVRLNIRPNYVTILSLVLAIYSSWLFYQGDFLVGGLVLGVSSLLDVVDGMLARLLDMQSSYGGALDSTVDRISEMFMYMGIILYFKDYVPGLISTIVALMGSFLVSYVSAQGTIYSVRLPRGLMRRGERSFYLAAGAILTTSFNEIFKINEPQRHILLVVILIFIGSVAILSSIYRLINLFRTLKQKK